MIHNHSTYLKQASITLMFACFFLNQLYGQIALNKQFDSYNLISIPSINFNESQTTITIAVIDDGFNLEHETLKGFIYSNEAEVPGNQIDDDGNGYIDDVHGWDIADDDNNVTLPKGRDRDFYHGTYIASIILEIGKRSFIKKSIPFNIIPIKVIEDDAHQFYIKNGYQALRYAMTLSPNIICMAWSGGTPTPEEKRLIQEAHSKGILLIASAGNLGSQTVGYPAIFEEVYAVAALDTLTHKLQVSNYGQEIDISTIGQNIKGAHPQQSNAYFTEDGTSQATAIVTGSAAILLSQKPTASAEEIKRALTNSSTPFSKNMSYYGGKLGSGILNLSQALAYLEKSNYRDQFHSPFRTKGSIEINKSSLSTQWEINPWGGFHHFTISPDITNIKKPEKHILDILVADTVWNSYRYCDIPKKLVLPNNKITLQTFPEHYSKKDIIEINFSSLPIDSSTLYCKELTHVQIDKGAFSDGSGSAPYANNCSCRWLIEAPEGKRIKFNFDLMNTEPNIDYVYLADGSTVVPEKIIAKFSGNTLPPEVTSRSNQVIVWFVTDNANNQDGWHLNYEFID